MIDFNSLSEFSRTHCLSICAFLVPANLFATLQTLILTGIGRSKTQVWAAAGIASIFAVAMVCHVWTWWAIGVVMAPTYILLSLGSLCLAINFWALVHPSSMTRLLRWLYLSTSGMLRRAKTAKNPQ